MNNTGMSRGRRRFIKWTVAAAILAAAILIGWRPLRRHLALWWFAAHGRSVGFQGHRDIQVRTQLPKAITEHIPAPTLLCVDMVGFTAWDSHVGDVGLRQLEFFPELQSVDVLDPTISASGLRGLGTLGQLRALTIMVPSGASGGFDALGNLDLKYLCLFESHLKDADLRVIGRMQNLEKFAVYGGSIRRHGLKELAPLKRLRRLRCWCADLGEQALVELPALASLTELDLIASVRDEHFKELQRFPRLRLLMAHSDQLTPECLRYLDEMCSLNCVGLWVKSPKEFVDAVASRPESQRPIIRVFKNSN